MAVNLDDPALYNIMHDDFSMGNDSEYNSSIVSADSKIGKTCAEFRGSEYIIVPRGAMVKNKMTMNV